VSNRPPDAQDRTRFTRQIDEAFEDASKLAGSSLAPSDFYEKFLTRTMGAINAPAGAVWLRTPQGFLQVAAQQNLEKLGLDERRGGRQCHNEILRLVFQAAPPRPVMIEPQGRLGGNAPVEPGAVPAANLTDYYALFAPIVGPEKQSLGLLELFQDTSHDPRLYQTFLQYALQMAGYASQYHSFANSRQAAGSEKVFTQIEAFARLIHGTLNPTECAYHIANEGRKLVEADRLCVGVRHGSKVKVEAVSGADVVEKASTHVRRMRALFDAVLGFNDKLVFTGIKDDALPPAVSRALDDYLAESQPKLLVVTPVRDDREKDADKPARSALLMEVFNPPEQTDALVQRLEVVGKHAAPALYNAAEMKRIPFKALWWPVVKVQDGLGGKAKMYTLLGVLAAAALVAALVLVPYPLKMDAKGQFLPELVMHVYPPVPDGEVRDVMVTKGQQGLRPGAPLVLMYSPDMAAKLNDYDQQHTSAVLTIDPIKNALNDKTTQPAQAIQLRQNLVEQETKARHAKSLQETLIAQNSLLTNPLERGFAVAKAPPLDSRFGGTWANITGADVRETIMRRAVRQSEPMLKLGAVDGPWRVDLKIPQRNVGHINKAFATPGRHQTGPDPKGSGKEVKFLPVDVLFGGFETAKYPGKMYEADVSVEAVPNKDDHNETEPVVQAYVTVDLSGLTADEQKGFKKAGAEVRVKVLCGDRALGYSLFHGVWEWFYEKVIFYF
jgi:hypothetical protein